MKKKKTAIIFILIILIQLAGGAAYYLTESSKLEYVKDLQFWSSLEGAASSYVSVDQANPVIKQEFVNQYEQLNGFVVFFYNCLETDSGRVYVRLKDRQETIYYEYQFETKYMTTDIFCLMLSPEEGIKLTAGETYYLEISVENMDAEDHIEIGSTFKGSKPLIFKELENGSTLFVKLDYTYVDTKPSAETIRTAAKICVVADILLVLACLWFIMKRRKLVASLVLIGFSGCVTFVAVRGYIASQKWYAKYSYMAHAMGSVDGKVYSNSRDAFELSYAGGHRVFEVDFSLTSDEKIVLWHDWEFNHGLPEFTNYTVPTWSEFKASKIWGKYETMDLEDLLDLMLEYPDIYVVTDSKSGEYKDVVKQFSQIAEMLQTYSEQERRSILKRLIVQIYNDDMYVGIESLLPIDNYIYTLYQRGTKDMDALCAFCIENKIPVVTLPYSCWTAEIHEILKNYDLEVWVHGINEFPGKEIDGVYTDISDLSMLKTPAD